MRHHRIRIGLAAALLVVLGDRVADAAELAPLKVAGTQVVNDKGERVRLRGVNAASLEWTCNGEGHILDTVRVAVQDWHCNVVRLPLSQDRWYGESPRAAG